jgi:2-dehydro-3-deoxygalactonokinase
MASSSIGWHDLPMVPTPVGVDGASIPIHSFNLALTAPATARIHLVAGVRTATDVMRGEETEIFGLFAEGRHATIAQDGIVILPGTHSKHVRLRGGKIIDLHTFLTGELFDVLTAHSVLRASTQMPEGVSAPSLENPAVRAAFAEGARAAQAPGLARSLFQTRARALLQGEPPAENRWYLSGLIIGAELIDLLTADKNLPLLLAAPEPMHAAYLLAAETLGLSQNLSAVPPAEMAQASVRGHRVLFQRGLR